MNFLNDDDEIVPVASIAINGHIDLQSTNAELLLFL